MTKLFTDVSVYFQMVMMQPLLWRRWLVLVRRLLRIGGELGHLLGAEGQKLLLLVDHLLLLVDRDFTICHLQHKRLGKRVELHQAVCALLQLLRELVHGQLFDQRLAVGTQLETWQ